MEAAEFLEQYLARAHQKAKRSPGQWVPRERVAAVVEEWIEQHEREIVGSAWARTGENQRRKLACSRRILAQRAGMSERAIWRLLCPEPKVIVKKRRVESYCPWGVAGGEPYLPLDLVDRLFIAMDRGDLWYAPPEQGGFSDIYWAAPQPLEEAA